MAHLSNVSFDAATFEIWGALLNGGRVVVIPRDTALAPRELAARLESEEVTTLFITTALFNQLVREEPAALAGLTHVLTGGEAVDPGAFARALSAGAPARLLHVYGPTETTTFATWHPVAAVAPGAASLPIERSIYASSLGMPLPDAPMVNQRLSGLSSVPLPAVRFVSEHAVWQ